MTEQNKTSNRSRVKTVDRDLVYKLACIQCTDQEIAEVVGLKAETLRKRFGAVIDAGKQKGRQSLRRAMWDKAINGDTRVAIFLSKQHLGMKDNPEDGEATTPLPWED